MPRGHYQRKPKDTVTQDAPKKRGRKPKAKEVAVKQESSAILELSVVDQFQIVRSNIQALATTRTSIAATVPFDSSLVQQVDTELHAELETISILRKKYLAETVVDREANGHQTTVAPQTTQLPPPLNIPVPPTSH